MPNVAVVTDSCASIPESLLQSLNIRSEPYNIHGGHEVEIQFSHGRDYSIQVRPYVGEQGETQGAVIAFWDHTELRQAQRCLQQQAAQIDQREAEERTEEQEQAAKEEAAEQAQKQAEDEQGWRDLLTRLAQVVGG